MCQSGATHISALWCCMWGRGQKGNNATCLAHHPLSVTSLAFHKWIEPFHVLQWHRFTGCWAGVCSWAPWAPLADSPVTPAGSPITTTPRDFYSQRFWSFLVPGGTLGCEEQLTPQLFLPAYPHTNVGPPVLPTAASHTHHLAGCPLHPSCASPLLPQVWVNVPSLTLWLSDFHTVQFSGSSGCFFLFKLVVILPLVGQGSEAYLPTPPSCPEVQNIIFYLIYVSFPQ